LFQVNDRQLRDIPLLEEEEVSIMLETESVDPSINLRSAMGMLIHASLEED
jgi:hypothetical protein